MLGAQMQTLCTQFPQILKTTHNGKPHMYDLSFFTYVSIVFLRRVKFEQAILRCHVILAKARA